MLSTKNYSLGNWFRFTKYGYDYFDWTLRISIWKFEFGVEKRK